MKNLPTKDDVLKNVIDFLKENENSLKFHYNSVINIDAAGHKKVVNESRYEEIDISKYNSELLKVSVVILTANFFESEILNHNIFVDTKTKIKKLKNGINLFPGADFRVVDAYIFDINNYKILHLHAPETGSNTPCGSSDLVRYVKNTDYLNPNCIISYGVCYGINPKEQNLGDTIVAQKIYPWSIAMKISEKDWAIKSDDYIIDLREYNSTLYHNINQLIRGEIDNCPYMDFVNVSMKNMVTGEAVVSNERFKREAIDRAHGFEICGGEMEGYGLAKECIYYNKTSCLIIKSICDWGALKNIDFKTIHTDLSDELKKDYKGKIQAYTSYCAYKFLRKLIFENILDNNNFYKEIEQILIDNLNTNFYIKDKYLKELVLHNIKKANLSVQIEEFTKLVIDNLKIDLIDEIIEDDKKSVGYRLK